MNFSCIYGKRIKKKDDKKYEERTKHPAAFLPDALFGSAEPKCAQSDAFPESISALAEGHAVGAGILCGIGFVGTHQNSIQRTVVFAGAVVGALVYGAFDALVCVAAHIKILL